MKQTDVPEIWQHLPFDRGYPVPYFVHWDGNTPNFHMADPRKWIACLKYKKCWICGQVLHTMPFIITGPMGLKNCVSTDTFMHEACARESLRLCPHMHYQKADRRKADAATLAAHPNHAMHKPLELALVKTGKWQIVDTGHTPIINYQPLAVQWFHYVDGLLVARTETLAPVASTGWKVNGYSIIPTSQL